MYRQICLWHNLSLAQTQIEVSIDSHQKSATGKRCFPQTFPIVKAAP